MNPLDELLRDAMTEHTEHLPHLRPGSARRALMSSRRRRRATMIAAGTATVAATAGVGAFAVHLQPASSVNGSYGGPGATHDATAKDPAAVKSHLAPVAPKVTTRAGLSPKVASGAPVPSADVSVDARDYMGKGEPEAAAPDDLRAATLIGPIEGLTITQEPSGTDHGLYYQLSDSGKWSKWYWFAPTGRSEELGSAGAVIITKGTSRPLWNQQQSPTPAVNTTTVNQRPGTVWLSGGDREIYYTAGDFTVEVFASDNGITLDQLKAIGDAVHGLPQ